MFRSDRIVIAENVPFGKFSATSTEYALERLANTEDADKISFYLSSTLDQAVTVQTIGSLDNSVQNLNEAVAVDASISVSDGSTTTQRASLTVNLEDNWHPWYGLTVTTGGTAPTAGRFVAVALVRRIIDPMGDNGELIKTMLQMQNFLAEMQQTNQAILSIAADLQNRPIARNPLISVGRR